MTLALLDAHVIETRPEANAAIIWMHGLGADGYDFAPIVAQLKLPNCGIRFVFPHAPARPVSINGGHVMRAWYDVVSFDREAQQDESGIRQSQAAINALIEQQLQQGIASERIVLAGFSQGGVIALQTGLRYPAPLAGIMALSTYLALGDSLAEEGSSANKPCPIFMAHGRFDGVIEPETAERSRERLAAEGYSVDWHEYPMAHAVCPQEISDISSFLKRVLG